MACLVKDPSKRPSAEQLLQTPFFRNAKKKNFLVHKILNNLPPLAQRQERRATSRHQTMRSIDSWDFTATVHSSTTSFRRHRSASEDSPAVEAVIELGETASIPSRTHSRAISFVDVAPPLREEDEPAVPEEDPPVALSSSNPSLGEVSDMEGTPSQGSSPPSSVNLAPPTAKAQEDMTPSQAIASSYSANAVAASSAPAYLPPVSVSPHRPPMIPSSSSFWRRLAGSAKRSQRSTPIDGERNEPSAIDKGIQLTRRLTAGRNNPAHPRMSPAPVVRHATDAVLSAK
ncbi:hypothetical protein HDZ31DRAFT_67744 [Schizophyllum fasciatum]